MVYSTVQINVNRTYCSVETRSTVTKGVDLILKVEGGATNRGTRRKMCGSSPRKFLKNRCFLLASERNPGPQRSRKKRVGIRSNIWKNFDEGNECPKMTSISCSLEEALRRFDIHCSGKKCEDFFSGVKHLNYIVQKVAEMHYVASQEAT